MDYLKVFDLKWSYSVISTKTSLNATRADRTDLNEKSSKCLKTGETTLLGNKDVYTANIKNSFSGLYSKRSRTEI